MRATAEIIDLNAVRERRKLAGRSASAPVTPGFTWIPVWFFGPVWMVMPVSAVLQRDG